MKTIVETPGEPYMVEDRTTPVFETKKHKSVLWLSLHEAMTNTGETIHDIVASADSQKPTKSGLQFGYPTRQALKQYLPDYRVVRALAHPPVPVLATFEIRSKRGRLRQDIPYRTLTAFRQCNELTTRSSEMIFSRQGGWKQLLPPFMISATPQKPGWVPTGGWPTTPGARTGIVLFQLTLVRGQIVIKYTGPRLAATFSDVPYVILSHAQ